MHLSLRYLAVCTALLCTFAMSADAQVRWISIETNQRNASVYADSTWLGRASLGFFEIPATTRQVTLVSQTLDAWQVPPISAELEASAGDTLWLDMDFPYYYRFESVPSGAKVFVERGAARELVGVTPLDIASELPLESMPSFEKAGYRTRRIEPGGNLWNRHLVLLEAIEHSDAAVPEISIQTGRSSRWIDYLAAGTAIAGGILAIHYKTKADNRFGAYNETRNPALKSDVKRLDVYSGVALGAMQVGLGVLAFRLIF